MNPRVAGRLPLWNFRPSNDRLKYQRQYQRPQGGPLTGLRQAPSLGQRTGLDVPPPPISGSIADAPRVRAWRFWGVARDGWLFSPFRVLEVDQPVVIFPAATVSCSDLRGDGIDPDGELSAFVDPTAAIGSMLLHPLPGAMLAYGEVELSGPVRSHPRPGVMSEVSTSGTLTIVSLTLSEAIPNATRCRVRLAYPSVRLLALWPVSWRREAATNRQNLQERVTALPRLRPLPSQPTTPLLGAHHD